MEVKLFDEEVTHGMYSKSMDYDKQLDFLKPRLEPLFPESVNSYVVPKHLTLPEFRRILNRNYPFQETSKAIKDFGIIHFPPEFELAEKRKFPGWEELKIRRIKSSAKHSYTPGVEDGVYLLKTGNPTSFRIKEYHGGEPEIVIVSPQAIQNEGKRIDDFVDEKILEAARTEAIEYVYDFEYSSEDTANHYHPFSLDKLDNPLREGTRGAALKGINMASAYYGKAKTSGFLWMSSEHNLGSINFHVKGSTKIFVTINPEDQILFELKLSEALRVSKRDDDCPAHPRRKSNRCLVTLKKLREWKVRYVIGFQQEGGYAFINFNVWHMTIDLGHNINRCVNYVDDDYFHAFKVLNCNSNCKYQCFNGLLQEILHEAWEKRRAEQPKDGKWLKLLDEEIARRRRVRARMAGTSSITTHSSAASISSPSSANLNSDGTFSLAYSKSLDHESTHHEFLSEHHPNKHPSKTRKRKYTPELSESQNV